MAGGTCAPDQTDSAGVSGLEFPCTPPPAPSTCDCHYCKGQETAPSCLHGGIELPPLTHPPTHTYTNVHKGFPSNTSLAESVPMQGLTRLPEQRPGRPKSSTPREEPRPPSWARLPCGGLGHQCTRSVHGAGGLRAGLCRPTGALAAAPPSSFTFSALTHRPPTRG